MAVWSAVVSVVVPLLVVAVVLLFSCQLTRCGVPLASTNRIYKEKQEQIFLAGWAWHDANDLSTSPWFGTYGIWVVLGYRCFLLAIFFLVVILEATQGTATSDWVTWFTNWTLIVFLIHSIIGIVQSVRGIRRGARRPEAEGWNLQSFDWLDKLHSIVATTVIAITLHITIFYWTSLHDGPDEMDANFKHTVNTGLLQIELWISSLPWTVTWVVFPTGYIMVYAIFTWVWHAAADSRVNDSLDYDKTSAPAMYVGVSVLVLFAFSICWLGAWAREKIAKRVLPAPSVLNHAFEKATEADHEVELGPLPQ